MYQPYNGVTKMPYTGATNIEVLTKQAQKLNCLTEPRWCTFLQAKQNGGKVRKGVHGVSLVYAKNDNAIALLASENETDEKKKKNVFKHFTVFNFSQIEWQNQGD